MSKYYKAEDVISFLNTHCPKDMWEYQIADLPTMEVSEENELKFYYVDSIDDYWIGRRCDNFYYAEWSGDYFVWTHSRYLPWGEHIVDENTLWKEHTYPSEPREIPLTEWIVGFMKKYKETEQSSMVGKWIDKGYYAVCSNCGAKSGIQFNGVEPIPLKTKFCGNCGLRMTAKDKDVPGKTYEEGMSEAWKIAQIVFDSEITLYEAMDLAKCMKGDE